MFLKLCKTIRYADITIKDTKDCLFFEKINEEPEYIEQPSPQRNTEQS